MRKINATIIAGAIVAVLGFALVLWYGTTVDKRIADGKKLAAVVVATDPLPAGATLDQIRSHVTVKQVPAAYLPGGALASVDDIGSQVLLGPVGKNDYLTRAKFGSAATATEVTPSAGHVALAIGVDVNPGVARYVQAGSYVDIFVTYGNYQPAVAAAGATPAPQASSAADQRTKLFASGVRVLSVSIAPPAAAPTPGPGQTSSTQLAQTTTASGLTGVTAVVDVDPQTAEQIVNGATLGKLYLALSSGDAHHTTGSGVVPGDVVHANR